MKVFIGQKHHRQPVHRIGAIMKMALHLVKQTMQTYSMVMMKRAVGLKTKKVIESQGEMVIIAE